MSAQPPTPTPVPDPKAGMKGKLFLFRQNAVKAGLSDDEIAAAVDSFETTADVETALGFWNDKTGPAVLAEKAKELKLNRAGTPPDKLPDSKAELVEPRFNSKAVENLDKMNILPGACPALRYNPDTNDLEVL